MNAFKAVAKSSSFSSKQEAGKADAGEGWVNRVAHLVEYADEKDGHTEEEKQRFFAWLRYEAIYQNISKRMFDAAKLQVQYKPRETPEEFEAAAASARKNILDQVLQSFRRNSNQPKGFAAWKQKVPDYSKRKQ